MYLNINNSLPNILSLCVILLILQIFLDWQNEKKHRPIMPPVPINFESDVQFLNYLIDHKITQTKLFLLEPLKIAGQKIINDKDFEGYKNNIISEVYMSISPNYKRILLKYFNEEGLVIYITEVIFREMTATCIELNFENFFNKKLVK